MLLNVQRVRRSATFATSATWVTGDGVGAENPINCAGADKLILFVYVDKPGGITDYSFKAEFYAGQDEPYAQTAGTVSTGTDTRSRTEVKLAATQITGTEQRFAVVFPVLGRFARVAAKSTFSTSPVCAVIAATATTVGGEGRRAGPYRVRGGGAVATTAPVYGDGPGGQNSVPIRSGDRIWLLLDGNIQNGGRLQLFMETSLDGLEFYRETYWSGSGIVNLYLKKYQFDYTEFGGAAVDGRLAFPLEALGAWARFNFATTTADANNVACQAIVGRV